MSGSVRGTNHPSKPMRWINTKPSPAVTTALMLAPFVLLVIAWPGLSGSTG
jgi:hypothetical protein